MQTRPVSLDPRLPLPRMGSLVPRSRRLRTLLMLALLALPFIGVSIWLDGLRVQLMTFHGTDETIYHLGVIERFAMQLPWPDLRDYNSATTPLFHLVFAAAARLLDLGLSGLRALNVLLSFGTVCWLFVLFSRHLRLPRAQALLAAAAFGASPYFFGASFLALTDNFAWGLALLAIGHLCVALERQTLRDWAWVSGLVALTLLSRQNYVWLYFAAVALAAVGGSPRPLQERVPQVLLVLASALPLVPLVLTWGGPVPPTFQLGGASGIEHRPGAGYNSHALLYALAVLGAYSVLLPVARRGATGRGPSRTKLALLVGVVGAGLMLLHPLQRVPEFHNGILWNLSERIPHVLGSSLIFWCLVPLGLYALVRQVLAAPRSLSTVGLLSIVGMAFVSSDFIFQKYFDPAIPLLLALVRQPGVAFSLRDRIAYAALLVGGVAYFVIQARNTVF